MALVVVEFALHLAYLQTLLHIVVHLSETDEIMEGVAELKYHLESTRTRGANVTMTALSGIIAKVGSLVDTFNISVSETIAAYKKTKRVTTKPLYAPYEQAVLDTATAFDLALATVGGLREDFSKHPEMDAITAARTKQLQEFTDQLYDLTEQISGMVRPGKLGFDSYGTLQRILAAFEIFFLILGGVQQVQLTPVDQVLLEKVDLLTQFMNQC